MSVESCVLCNNQTGQGGDPPITNETILSINFFKRYLIYNLCLSREIKRGCPKSKFSELKIRGLVKRPNEKNGQNELLKKNINQPVK